MKLTVRQQRVLALCWRIVGAFFVLFFLCPVANTISRLTVIGSGGLLWLGALLFLKGHPTARWWKKPVVEFLSEADALWNRRVRLPATMCAGGMLSPASRTSSSTF